MPLKRKTVPLDLDISEIGMDIAEVIVRSKLCKTKSEARRMITQGTFKMDDCVIEDKFARLAWTGDEWVLLEHKE